MSTPCDTGRPSGNSGSIKWIRSGVRSQRLGPKAGKPYSISYTITARDHVSTCATMAGSISQCLPDLLNHRNTHCSILIAQTMLEFPSVLACRDAYLLIVEEGGVIFSFLMASLPGILKDLNVRQCPNDSLMCSRVRCMCMLPMKTCAYSKSFLQGGHRVARAALWM